MFAVLLHHQRTASQPLPPPHTHTHTHTTPIYTQLAEAQEANNAQWREEVARVRQSTAREVQGYYLRCLHQLNRVTPLTEDQILQSHGHSHDLPHGHSHDLPHGHSHDPPHGHSHDPPHGHSRDPPHGQSHDPPHGQSHDPPHNHSHDPPHGHSHDPPREDALWDTKLLEAKSNVRPERTLHVAHRRISPAKHTEPAGVKHSAVRPSKEAAPKTGRSQRRSDVRKNAFGVGRAATQKRGH